MGYKKSFCFSIFLLLSLSIFKVLYFTLIYPDYFDVSGYKFVNIDEYRYYSRAISLSSSIESYGWLYAFENFYDYTQSFHALYYFFLALFKIVLGQDFVYFFILFKITFVTFLVFLILYYLLSRYMHKKTVLVSCVFFILYPTYIMYSFSLMRDDITLLSLLSFLYAGSNLIRKKSIFNVLLLIISILFLMQMRISLLPVGLIVLISLELKIKKLNFNMSAKILTLFFLSCIPIYLLLYKYLLILTSSLPSLTQSSFAVIKMYLSPLPWSLSENYSIIRYWVWISFIFSVISLFFIKQLMSSLLNNKIFFSGIFFVYFLPYIIRDGSVGIRQLSLVIPIIVPILYSKLIESTKFGTKNNTKTKTNKKNYYEYI